MSADGMKSLLKSAARETVSQALHLAPTAFWRRLFPKTAVGVCYHVVSDRPLAHVKHYRFLNRADFEADLRYLRSRFGFLSYAELAERRASSRTVRDNAAILTFDDGFAECFTEVTPVLGRLGLTGVFFLITDLIDNTVIFRESAASLCIEKIRARPVEQILAMVDALGLNERLKPPPRGPSSAAVDAPLVMADLGETPDARLRPFLHWLLTLAADETALLDALCARLDVDPKGYVQRTQPYLTTDQIRQMHADGFTIGAHSRSHRLLQDLTRDEAEREIVESCRIVQGITGQASVPFAFPYSGAGLDRAWLRDLRRRHEVIGLFFDTDGLREDEPMVVQRVFGERLGRDRTMDAILRRAWSRRPAWRFG
jgi:peptidoglycan/xylan/chitin deacetylase (PgdA/CDA1 family)